jgi:prepilin-type N-terminal cleavage/methylation domain-containing protein
MKFLNNKGFSLIEMLVVIVVVSIFGLLMLQIFTQTLRGNNKARVVSSLKQNGQFVLETMDKEIRNSQSVICPLIPASSNNTASDSILLRLKDGKYNWYKYSPATSTQNGQIMVGEIKSTSISLDPSLLANFCTTGPSSTDYVSNSSLTNTDIKTGVSVVMQPSPDDNFITREKVGDVDVITIKFQVSKAINMPSAFVDQVDPVVFQTTVQVR